MLTTPIDLIEVTQRNALQVRMRKQIVIEGATHDLGFHRTCIEPSDDIDATFAAVNEHLAEMKLGPVPAEDIDRVKKIAAAILSS